MEHMKFTSSHLINEVFEKSKILLSTDEEKSIDEYSGNTPVTIERMFTLLNILDQTRLTILYDQFSEETKSLFGNSVYKYYLAVLTKQLP